MKDRIIFYYEYLEGLVSWVKKIIKIFIDLDGTICGSNNWSGLFINNRKLFGTGKLMDMPNHSWKLLTSRPKIDKFLIKRVLRKYKLFPDKIILGPTWFYKFKNIEDVANWKSSILSKEVDNMFVDKVIYVDSDANILSKMINHKNITLCKPDILHNVIKDLEV